MTNQPPVEEDWLPEKPVTGGTTAPGASPRQQAHPPEPPSPPPKTEVQPEQITFWIILVILFLVSLLAAYLFWAKLTGHVPWS